MRDHSERHQIMQIIDVANNFRRIPLKFCQAGLLASIFIFSNFAQAEEIKPFWKIEDADLETHVRSLVYLRDLITLEGKSDTTGKVNFVFLSGSDYIQNGKLNIDLVASVLGIADPSYLDEYSTPKENCLILTLNGTNNHQTTLAINGTPGPATPEDFKCAVVALLKFEGIETPASDQSSAKIISLKLIKQYLKESGNE